MSRLRHGKERSGGSDAPVSSVFATSPLVRLSSYATKFASHIILPPSRYEDSFTSSPHLSLHSSDVE